MVASLLAVGAAPAGAIESNPDARATWKVCLGEATASRGFIDVSASSVHATNINCLSYYGITVGKTAHTFAPNDYVTRSQMALILTRAAAVADIDLGEATDAGFIDIDMVSAEKRSAINRLAARGIMEGRTTTTFEPYGLVTRTDMALHLFALLDLALDSVLVDEFPDSVEGNEDGTGHIELNDHDGDGRGIPVDDYFRDARRTVPAHVDNAIGALYELGVITGTNNRVGADGTFKPFAPVTRAQMASIIMRALGHTNLRPAGVTAQSTVDSTQVSVRDEDFAPVVDAPVELIGSDYPEFAFDSDGKCVTDRFVIPISPGFDLCRIDVRDELTDDNGNATFGVGTGYRNPVVIACSYGVPYTVRTNPRHPSANFTLWAWSGVVGDTVDGETEFFEPVPANVVNPQFPAVGAVITGGSSTHVKMGSRVTYKVQLVDENGDPTGLWGGGEDGFVAVVSKTTQRIDTATGAPIEDDPGTLQDEAFDLSVEIERSRLRGVIVPDSDGRFTVSVTNRDRHLEINDPDVRVKVTLMGTVSRPPGALSVDTSWDSAYVRFSDDDPRAATATLETAPWRLWTSGRQYRHSIRMVVVDQYGDRFRNRSRSYYVTASATGDDASFERNSDTSVGDSSYFMLPTTGRMTFGYDHQADRPLVQTVAASGRVAVIEGGAVLFPPNAPEDMQPTSVTGTVLWAGRGTSRSRSDVPVLLGDARSNSLIVDEQGFDDGNGNMPQGVYPVAYEYDDDDSFAVEGVRVTVHQFEEILISPLVHLSGLSWTGFDRFGDEDHATWRLDGLICSVP